MNPASLVLLAFAMSTDAFAASIGKGASLKRTRFPEALRIGVIFGTIEAITPVIGWAIGLAATHFVSEWDHWIAFVLLAGLGSHMIWAGLKPDDPRAQEDADVPARRSFWLVAATALATSIDAMAVGVTLAFADINILVAAMAIGLATTLMVTIGIMLGRAIGSLIGKRAEIGGGLVMIVIGCMVLYQHLAGA
ncbi:manganese efflux pump MntP [Salinicola endophyticus]|uniref:Putative manganese efflux pump MntP n=1 Tax=Salinicola endophyticus TaxID=1949083 RepID=A0ABY8FHE5_9GAMM|nr:MULTISPECIES: manganese efflux pump MntP [Salinicola]WFF41490.1 manganese efflux pump MntP [Salinicola endophyticus]